VRAIRRGDTGPAVSEIRSILVGLTLLSDVSDTYDESAETAVRAFQQSRGIGVDGVVGPETWQALDGARWKLGARTLYHSIPSALFGEDVRALQERLLEMGYDTGRADAIYGARTAHAVAQFQREVGLSPRRSASQARTSSARRS
jgi:N-acetylmuramoyl-L-alanine amidase